jgi:hypothetical protein
LQLKNSIISLRPPSLAQIILGKRKIYIEVPTDDLPGTSGFIIEVETSVRGYRVVGILEKLTHPEFRHVHYLSPD